MDGVLATLANFVIGFVIVFAVIALLSLPTARLPATPPFARRAPTSSSPQLRQDANAHFFYDRGFMFRRRCWFTGTCCPPIRLAMAQFGQLDSVRQHQPVRVAQAGGRV